VKQQTRRLVVAAFVVAALLVLIASVGIGSQPNPLARKAESSTVNTLVGGLLVIAGGALGIAGNYWIETRRWKREDEYRNYADRQRVYAEFSASWYSYEEVKNTRFGGEAGWKALEEAHRQLQRSFNTLSLIAPDEVRAAAEDVLMKKPDAYPPFWKAARKDLGKWPPR
jgi:hypothetical protein